MANFTQTYFDFSFLITSFCPIQGFSLFPNLEFNHKIVAVTGRASLRWRMSAILTLQRQRQEDVEFDPCLSCIWRKHIRVIQVSGSPRCEVSLVFNLYLCAPLLFPAAPSHIALCAAFITSLSTLLWLRVQAKYRESNCWRDLCLSKHCKPFAPISFSFLFFLFFPPLLSLSMPFSSTSLSPFPHLFLHQPPVITLSFVQAWILHLKRSRVAWAFGRNCQPLL